MEASTTTTPLPYQFIVGKDSMLFPYRLHEMLEYAESNNLTDIVSWTSDTTFKVHKQQPFADVIMPQYFNQTKFKSFQRQLNLWGFRRQDFYGIVSSPGQEQLRGSYHHPMFVRRQYHLCQHMSRHKQQRRGTPAMKATSTAAAAAGAAAARRMSASSSSSSTTTSSSANISPSPFMRLLLQQQQQQQPNNSKNTAIGMNCAVPSSIDVPSLSLSFDTTFEPIPAHRHRPSVLRQEFDSGDDSFRAFFQQLISTSTTTTEENGYKNKYYNDKTAIVSTVADGNDDEEDDVTLDDFGGRNFCPLTIQRCHELESNNSVLHLTRALSV